MLGIPGTPSVPGEPLDAAYNNGSHHLVRGDDDHGAAMARNRFPKRL
ncbi:MAG TPA: hypothetical protein VLJ37_09210 [bacterium]|nr:hypothetical protein [bacterium]